MPRPRKPARLYYREATGRWVIKDGDDERATGAFGRDASEAAEQALAEYLAGRPSKWTGPAHAHQVAIADVLELYVRERGPDLADPQRLKSAASALDEFWGDLTCDAVKGATCRAYEKHRAKPREVVWRSKRGKETRRKLRAGASTVRRELGVLQAALNHAAAEGLLISTPTVTLTPHGAPRDRWLERDEVARLVREARRGRNPGLARAILVGCYTGTRPGTVLRIRLLPTITGPWIDVARGILHRRGGAERETKKRRGDCRMPASLAAHTRRWSAKGGEWLISWGGKPVRNVRKGLAAACVRAGLEPITPHVWKHTAVTWFFQNGGSIEDAADYFATSAQTLERVYRQHSPHYQDRAAGVMSRRPSRPSAGPKP